MSKRISSIDDVIMWYSRIWHRYPREDEVERHLQWQTPFSRLINWLVDETPDELIGWHMPLPKELKWKLSAYYLDPAYKRQWGFEHYGWDIPYPMGTNVLCAGQGVVEKIGFDDGIWWPRKSRKPYGNHVIVRHNKHFRTLYAHLQRIDVVPGWFVPSDYKLGTGDSTGWSTNNHLHVELQEKKYGIWRRVDPSIKIVR